MQPATRRQPEGCDPAGHSGSHRSDDVDRSCGVGLGRLPRLAQPRAELRPPALRSPARGLRIVQDYPLGIGPGPVRARHRISHPTARTCACSPSRASWGSSCFSPSSSRHSGSPPETSSWGETRSASRLSPSWPDCAGYWPTAPSWTRSTGATPGSCSGLSGLARCAPPPRRRLADPAGAPFS